MAYTIHSITEAGEHMDGARKGLRAALSLARQRWREYRCDTSGVRIVVKWGGVIVADDPSDFTLSRRRWHMDPFRHSLPR